MLETRKTRQTIEEKSKIYKYIRSNVDTFDKNIINFLSDNKIRIPLDTIIETDETEEYNGGLRSILNSNRKLRRKTHCYSRRKCVHIIYQRRNDRKSRSKSRKR